ERAIDLNAIKEEGAAKLGVIYTSYPSFKENRALINEEPEDMILHYLYASSACFPIFPLHKIGKKTYIDGGFSNNLPIDYALDLGADYVYAIGLRSFPTPPQKPHFLTLPNVKTIFQSRSLGFMMDFDPKTLARNRIMGYLDAGRVLGDYYGSKYALRHSETDLEKAHAFFMKALEKGPKSFKSLKTLFHVKGKKIDEISLYVGALEFVAGSLEVDEYHLYSFDTMLDAIKDKAAKVNDALKKRKPNIRYLSEMILGKEIDKKTKRGVNAKLLLMPPLL
ncbi:MAG: patatin-like phospholipase family protein, partial [Bacilli bacterium]|nr:patatin-like phospholipase family protein [Bacilli bacterium]